MIDVLLWSLVKSTRPDIGLFEPLIFEITTKNYNYFSVDTVVK